VDLEYLSHATPQPLESNYQIIRLRGGGSQDERAPTLQSCEANVQEPIPFLKHGEGLAENSNNGRLLVFDVFGSAESSLLCQILSGLAEVPKMALVNYTKGHVESIAPKQSQEVAELREEVATIKEEVKALKDFLGIPYHCSRGAMQHRVPPHPSISLARRTYCRSM